MGQEFQCVTRDCTATFTRKGGKCPQCKQPVMTPGFFKVSLWVRLIAGLILVAIMVPVLAFVGPILLDPDADFELASRYSPYVVLGLLLSLLAFGVMMSVLVIGEMRANARNPHLMKYAFAMFAVIVAFIVALGLLEPEVAAILRGD